MNNSIGANLWLSEVAIWHFGVAVNSGKTRSLNDLPKPTKTVYDKPRQHH